MTMKEREIHKLKKMVEGLKDIGLTSTIHQFSFSCYLYRENDI